MSFSTNGQIEVTDSAPVTVTYSEVSNTGSRCLYADRAREIGVPRRLEISHQSTGTGSTARLRSMVKFSNNIENPSLEGDVVESRVHVVIDTPLRICDADDVLDIITQLIDVMSGATFVAQILNQEV